MILPLFQIDSFTSQLFKGNPAAVVPLTHWLPDELMKKIARENAVAETAFLIIGEEQVELRWFTPDIEMDLCGHATLAAAHALRTLLDYIPDTIRFTTLSGELRVTCLGDTTYQLDFPSRMPVPAELPEAICKALNIQPAQVFKARDYMLVYETELAIRNIRVDRQAFDKINLDPGGLIVTARGEEVDFVSRYFTPQSTHLEDPVTGSAHCTLIPYWSGILGKEEMRAMQLSERSGQLQCVNAGERVLISGQARTYSTGSLVTE